MNGQWRGTDSDSVSSKTSARGPLFPIPNMAHPKSTRKKGRNLEKDFTFRNLVLSISCSVSRPLPRALRTGKSSSLRAPANRLRSAHNEPEQQPIFPDPRQPQTQIQFKHWNPQENFTSTMQKKSTHGLSGSQEGHKPRNHFPHRRSRGGWPLATSPYPGEH